MPMPHRLSFCCTLLFGIAPAFIASAAQRPTQVAAPGWTGTWAASPCPPPAPGERTQPLLLHNESLRLIVHTTIGGDAVRIRLSNTFGKAPLKIGAAHIGLRESGNRIRTGTDHLLHFSGRTFIEIPVGASVLSDSEPLPIAAMTDLAVSLYLPGDVADVTLHPLALQTSYRTNGDSTAEADWAAATTIHTWPYLTEVEVKARQPQRAIVAIGSSTTDGYHSTPDANRRWPDVLTQRLQANPATRGIALLNQGISGNRVMHDGRGASGNAFGPSAIARFDRDVLAMAGVDTMIMMEGGNDINHPGAAAPIEETITPEDLIVGYRQIIARAHEHGIRVILGTIMPFEGSVPAAVQPERERFRLAVNQWVLNNHDADGVIDFATIIADPAHPARFAPQYDSGDHLHPNDAGYKAMADHIDIKLLTTR